MNGCRTDHPRRDPRDAAGAKPLLPGDAGSTSAWTVLLPLDRAVCHATIHLGTTQARNDMMAKKLALILSLTFALSVNASADGGLDIRESSGESDTQDMSENIQVQCVECLIPVNPDICDEGRFECQEYTSPL